MSLLTVQPVKFIYVLLEVLVILFIRLPLWLLLALPRCNRARPSWTIKREVMVRIMRQGAHVLGRVGPLTKDPDYLAVESTSPNVEGVWIPAAPHLIVGEVKGWACLANVQAVRIPGYWYERDGTDLPVNSRPRAGEKVIFALHGGGYTMGSAHSSDISANIPRGLLQHAPPSVVRCLALEYRLSKSASESPSNPFPAALIDAVAGYNYLVNDIGFLPEDIIVQGSSAGGNLALALVRYLVRNRHCEGIAMPRPPGGLILCAPWVDLSPITQMMFSSVYTNAGSDFVDVTARLLRDSVTKYVGPLGDTAAASNPYISPAPSALLAEKTSFVGFPHTFLVCSDGEVMRDDIHRLRDMMKGDLGPASLTFIEVPDGVHDFLMLKWHEPERTEVLRSIAKWIISL